MQNQPTMLPDGHGSRTPQVLVAVLNFNATDVAVQTLDSFARQTYPNADIVLVDNASTNDCVAHIMAARPDTQVIRYDRNTGYAGGNNAIIRHAKEHGYDHVIVANSDIEVDPRSVEWLVETAEKHPLAGTVGGIEVSHKTGDIRLAYGAGFSLWSGVMEWVYSPKHIDGDSARCGYVHGALVLYTRAAMERGLSLDERLFMYMEEPDLGFQLKKLGLEAYVDRRVSVHHKNSDTASPGKGYYLQRNRLYLVRKHGRWYNFLACAAVMGLVEIPVKSVRKLAAGQNEYAFAWYRGYLDALRNRMGKRF